VLDWQLPYARWFKGDRLNACYNCVDRHTVTWRRSKVAIYWEGEPGDVRVLCYSTRDLGGRGGQGLPGAERGGWRVRPA